MVSPSSLPDRTTSVLAIKDGVRLENVKPQMVLAAFVIASRFDDEGYDCVITGGSEDAPGRSSTSLHPSGFALDFRLNHIANRGRAHRLLLAISGSLPEDQYDLIAHGDAHNYHLHVEFDPK